MVEDFIIKEVEVEVEVEVEASMIAQEVVEDLVVQVARQRSVPHSIFPRGFSNSASVLVETPFAL